MDHYSEIPRDFLYMAGILPVPDGDVSEDTEPEVDENTRLMYCAFQEFRNLGVLKAIDAHPELSPTQFGRLAAMFSGADRPQLSLAIIEKGLERFPKTLPLLTSGISAAAVCGLQPTAETYFRRVWNEIPRNQLDSPAYRCIIRYLLRAPEQNETLCREALAEFGAHFPRDEDVICCAYEVEHALGNFDAAEALLKGRLEQSAGAIRCAQKLLRLQLERGAFRDALTTAVYGQRAIAASAEPVNEHIDGAFTVGALRAHFGLLFQNYMDGITVPSEQMHTLYTQLCAFERHYGGGELVIAETMRNKLEYLMDAQESG